MKGTESKYARPSVGSAHEAEHIFHTAITGWNQKVNFNTVAYEAIASRAWFPHWCCFNNEPALGSPAEAVMLKWPLRSPLFGLTKSKVPRKTSHWTCLGNKIMFLFYFFFTSKSYPQQKLSAAVIFSLFLRYQLSGESMTTLNVTIFVIQSLHSIHYMDIHFNMAFSGLFQSHIHSIFAIVFVWSFKP